MEETANISVTDGNQSEETLTKEKEKVIRNPQMKGRIPKMDKGMGEIIPINPKKFYSLTIDTWTDTRTGQVHGIPRGKDKEGNTLYKVITITGRRIYDLNILTQEEEFKFLKSYPEVEGSTQQVIQPILKVIDRRKESEQFLTKMETKRRALDLAANLPESELNNFARVLGMWPDNSSPLIIRAEIMKKAEEEPAEFIRKFTSENRMYEEVINKGLQVTKKTDTGKIIPVIARDFGVYKYGELQMGTTMEQVIFYLKQNADIFHMIKEDCGYGENY